MRNSDSPTKRSVETFDVIALWSWLFATDTRENDYDQISLLADSSPLTFTVSC